MTSSCHICFLNTKSKKYPRAHSKVFSRCRRCCSLIAQKSSHFFPSTNFLTDLSLTLLARNPKSRRAAFASSAQTRASDSFSVAKAFPSKASIQCSLRRTPAKSTTCRFGSEHTREISNRLCGTVRMKSWLCHSFLRTYNDCAVDSKPKICHGLKVMGPLKRSNSNWKGSD
ncbi:MAG: hypothetical protein K940chlam2_00361 [Chlamydiae bacterium]|nr:hypothetical protein [Chlamydiota bacterium]